MRWTLSLWLRRCAVRESHKHPWTVVTHVHTQPCVCVKMSGVYAHSFTPAFTETQTNVGLCAKCNSQQNRKIVFFLQACPHTLSRKSRHAAFTQQQQPYLLLNNTVVSLYVTDWVFCIWALGWGYSYSVSECRDYSSTRRVVSRPFLRMSFKLFKLKGFPHSKDPWPNLPWKRLHFSDTFKVFNKPGNWIKFMMTHTIQILSIMVIWDGINQPYVLAVMADETLI